MHISEGFIIREIAGETIAIPSGEAARDLSGLIALNPSGRILFDKLRSEQTVESLTETLLENFDIDYETAKNDVEEFLDILRNSGVLIEC